MNDLAKQTQPSIHALFTQDPQSGLSSSTDQMDESPDQQEDRKKGTSEDPSVHTELLSPTNLDQRQQKF